MIAIDLCKQQALDTDPKAIQLINFIGNLSDNNNRWTFFIIEEAKGTILDFSEGTARVLWVSLCKAFANGSSANIKLSKTQLHKLGRSGGFLGIDF